MELLPIHFVIRTPHDALRDKSDLLPKNFIVGIRPIVPVGELHDVLALVILGRLYEGRIQIAGIWMTEIYGKKVLALLPLAPSQEHLTVELFEEVVLDNGDMVAKLIPSLELIERKILGVFLPDESRKRHAIKDRSRGQKGVKAKCPAFDA